MTNMATPLPRILTTPLGFLLVCAVVGLSLCSVNKVKRMVQYRVAAIRIDHDDILDTLSVAKAVECYAACARQPGCLSVNFSSMNRKCELLATYGLSTCEKEPPRQTGWEWALILNVPLRVEMPWQTVGPRDPSIGAECWTWSWYDGSAPIPNDTLILFPDDQLTVGSVFASGRYLPASLEITSFQYNYGSHSPFPHVTFNTCRPGTGGYVFRNTGVCTTDWLNITIGDPAPENAMVGGFNADGSHVYIAYAEIGPDKLIGGYDPTAKEALLTSSERNLHKTGDLISILLVNEDALSP